MNLNVDKYIVLSILLFSAVFAVTMISTASLANHALRIDPAVHGDSQNSLTLTSISDPVNDVCVPCGGDPIPGGGFP